MGMLGVTALTRISHLVKIVVVASFALIQVTMNFTKLRQSFRWNDLRLYENNYKIGHEVVLSVAVLTIAVILLLINRQVRFPPTSAFVSSYSF